MQRKGRKLDVEMEVATATSSHIEDPNQPATADEVDVDVLALIMDEMQRFLWWDDGAGCWNPDKTVEDAEVREHLTALMTEHGLRPGGDDDED